MAYTVNRQNGAVLTTIADGTIDTVTDLTLIGKNYSGYGELLNENFVKLLENFSNTSQPSNPISGQLWWDSTNGLLKAYTGSAFKVIGGSTSSATAPASAAAGDLWFDSTNQQLSVYSGTAWVLVGPSFTSLTGESGAIVKTITDNLGSNHVVVELFVNDTIVGTVSKDSTFTPQTAVAGFATIKPGIQLSSAVSGAKFQGDATNADTLDSLDSTQFLRSDTNDTTTGVLTVANDSGIIVGADNDLTLAVSGANTLISNASSDGDILVRINKSVGGVTTALTIDGATGYVSLGTSPAAGNDSTNIATTAWVFDNATALDGSNAMTGDLLPSADSTHDIGSTTFKWANVYADTLNGTAVEALYADLAERFEADAEYSIGTVVSLGGAAEVTEVSEEASESVFGVVSGKAAYLMNARAGSNATHPAIAMTGRVPVRVVGTVLKGQRLISSSIPGVARAAQSTEVNSFNVVGRALEDKYTHEEGTVLAVVRIN
jgi:hypothetical protein